MKKQHEIKFIETISEKVDDLIILMSEDDGGFLFFANAIDVTCSYEELQKDCGPSSVYSDYDFDLSYEEHENLQEILEEVKKIESKYDKEVARTFIHVCSNQSFDTDESSLVIAIEEYLENLNENDINSNYRKLSDSGYELIIKSSDSGLARAYAVKNNERVAFVVFKSNNRTVSYLQDMSSKARKNTHLDIAMEELFEKISNIKSIDLLSDSEAEQVIRKHFTEDLIEKMYQEAKEYFENDLDNDTSDESYSNLYDVMLASFYESYEQDAFSKVYDALYDRGYINDIDNLSDLYEEINLVSIEHFDNVMHLVRDRLFNV